MFQTFEGESDSSLSAARIAGLRKWLDDNGLDGFLVPRADEHQGEYVAARSERSMADGLGFRRRCADHARQRPHLRRRRYQLQVRNQVDGRFSPSST
jgi:Xaa-Pro aminopeptidase